MCSKASKGACWHWLLLAPGQVCRHLSCAVLCCAVPSLDCIACCGPSEQLSIGSEAVGTIAAFMAVLYLAECHVKMLCCK